MALYSRLPLIIVFALMTVPCVSSIILLCNVGDVTCDISVTDSTPPKYFGDALTDAVQARLFSQPEYEGSQLDVPEGMTELANYPIDGGSIVVREGWRVVITTLQGARFVEKLYVYEEDMPHVSFAGVRIMRVLVEKI
jgi:hypothetical protein